MSAAAAICARVRLGDTAFDNEWWASTIEQGHRTLHWAAAGRNGNPPPCGYSLGRLLIPLWFSTVSEKASYLVCPRCAEAWAVFETSVWRE